MPRYTFARMTPGDLSRDLHQIGISAGQFARLGVAGDKRIKEWLEGKEDIPPWVPVLLDLMKLPGAPERARATAEHYLTEE